MSLLDAVSDRPSFPQIEEAILAGWKENNTFRKVYQRSVDEGRPAFTFYDGPPFATGLPHFGHILAGSIKDIIGRYAHQTGHSVQRRFGWDCHGLPVEHEVDKILGVQSKQDVLETHGIAKYNETCRSIVMRYAAEWRTTIERMGRWVDFDHDYKTMQMPYMESVWWVFKQLHDKGLVYRSFKVMPFSTACTTPLSNFEAGQNYKDVTDVAVTVSFPLVDDESTSLLAWTTTPWTLPSSIALAVNPTFDYVTLTVEGWPGQIIVAECRVEWLKAESKRSMSQVGASFKGSTLVGKRFTPMFDCFSKAARWPQGWQILPGDFVTSKAGTGVVQMAPAFGEDDYDLCAKAGVIDGKGGDIPRPINDDGVFTEEVDFLSGVYFKDADKEVRKRLKTMERLFCESNCMHSYPHCWRSDTPLIYRAVPSWFIRVESIKDRIIENNKTTRWVPAFVQEKRFHNWLVDARDWCVSRNRYWGTPLPIWTSEDYTQVHVIGSVAELEELSGEVVSDLHSHHIDHLTIPDPRGAQFPRMHRVPEVFDCWFESGSMPYAQVHYPFENKEEFPFPADFIGEGLDQTRGWFYTLMVLSTALFDCAPWKNLIVNGLILAGDGKKMSKRLKNYPEPTVVADKYGADAMRLYLVNSPASRAESLRFKEDGVHDVLKDVFLPWYHATRFLIQETTRYENDTKSAFVPDESKIQKSANILDRWVYASSQSLIKLFRTEMDNYNVFAVAPRLVCFLEQLTNWYLRLNRDRSKGGSGEQEQLTCLNTLFNVIMTINVLMAPFTPFLAEFFYGNLKCALPADQQRDTVHDVSLPQPNEAFIDPQIETLVHQMQAVICVGRNLREKRRSGLKTPVKNIKIIHPDMATTDSLKSLQQYVESELNVLDVGYLNDQTLMARRVTPNFRVLGGRVGGKMKAIAAAVSKLSAVETDRFLESGCLEVEGETLTSADVVVSPVAAKNTFNDKNVDVAGDDQFLVAMDFTSDDSIVELSLVREITNRVQKMRKELKLNESDNTTVMYIKAESAGAVKVVQTRMAEITSILRRPLENGWPTGECEVRSFEANGEQFQVAFVM